LEFSFTFSDAPRNLREKTTDCRGRAVLGYAILKKQGKYSPWVFLSENRVRKENSLKTIFTFLKEGIYFPTYIKLPKDLRKECEKEYFLGRLEEIEEKIKEFAFRKAASIIGEALKGELSNISGVYSSEDTKALEDCFKKLGIQNPKEEVERIRQKRILEYPKYKLMTDEEIKERARKFLDEADSFLRWGAQGAYKRLKKSSSDWMQLELTLVLEKKSLMPKNTKKSEKLQKRN
jgi:hypothetical protein